MAVVRIKNKVSVDEDGEIASPCIAYSRSGAASVEKQLGGSWKKLNSGLSHDPAIPHVPLGHAPKKTESMCPHGDRVAVLRAASFIKL